MALLPLLLALAAPAPAQIRPTGAVAVEPPDTPTTLRRGAVSGSPAGSSERPDGVRRIDVRPFDDVRLELELSPLARGAARSSWSGRALWPQPGRALLSERDGAWQLNLWLDDGRLFELRGGDDGPGIALELAPEAFDPCGTDGHAIDLAPPDPAPLAAATDPPGCVDDGTFVDVMVAYTAGARAAQGGTAAMLALIDQAEASVNQAYADSQIPLTLRVVHSVEVSYSSSGSAFTDLDRLLLPFDGFLDELHPLRDQKRADLVSLIVNNFDKCGLAELAIGPGNSPRPGKAFNVIERDCAVPQFVFAHENAHNQGSLHDRGQNPGVSAGAYPYSYGYNGGSFRTIMVASSGGTRINRFSNPDVLFGGQPTGVPTNDTNNSAHNAMSLTQTAYNVSRFRCSLFDCNGNGVEDAVDVTSGTSLDCNTNQIPDECEDDCNANGVPDDCDLFAGTSDDCNDDGTPDECELPTEDCNANGTVDECDVAAGTSTDCNANGLPDECETDCNANGIEDSCDLASGTSFDCQDNGTPDECDASAGGDVDGDGVPDTCQDCDGNGTLDSTDVAGGQLTDADLDGVPDECERVRNVTRGRQHATIQLALDASFDGDTIEAGPGVYGELIDFIGREVTLRSTDGAAATTIDGTGLDGSVVTMQNLEDSLTVLDGFTLTGGQGSPLQSGFRGGGGIHASNVFDAQIVGCIVYDNRADVGAGVFVGGGGAALQLRNVELRRNWSRQRGGAIYVESGFGTVDVVHATILDNIAPQGGGALYMPTLGNASIANSIVRDNGAAALDGDIAVESSNVEGGGGGTNIDADPLFVDAAGGDLRLADGSPCIDSADNGLLPADAADLDGDGDLLEPLSLDLGRVPRVAGPGASPTADMGAHERQPVALPPPVPDGTAGSEPLRASRLDPAGTSLELSWDDGCPQASTAVLYGSLDTVAGWSLDGALCDVVQPTTWSAVPAGDLWFVVVGQNENGIEGSWGLAAGGERGSGPSGACGVSARSTAAACP